MTLHQQGEAKTAKLRKLLSPGNSNFKYVHYFKLLIKINL
jgi:hypothetical protein